MSMMMEVKIETLMCTPVLVPVNLDSNNIKQSFTVCIYDFVLSEEDSNIVRVGNITFRPKEVLGHGAEGTIVYK